jgi:hypothetical protein
LSCAALEAQASSSGYEGEVQLKLKHVSLKLSSFQTHEKNSLKKWIFTEFHNYFQS